MGYEGGTLKLLRSSTGWARRSPTTGNEQRGLRIRRTFQQPRPARDDVIGRCLRLVGRRPNEKPLTVRRHVVVDAINVPQLKERFRLLDRRGRSGQVDGDRDQGVPPVPVEKFLPIMPPARLIAPIRGKATLTPGPGNGRMYTSARPDSVEQ